MKRLTIPLLTILTVLLAFSSHAQSKLTGQIIDDAEKTKLQNATVMLLQAKDSILVNFTRADGQGKFSLPKADGIDYLLVITYPKFGDFAQTISKDQKDVALGEIGLTPIENLIEEVLITGRMPIVIKGDTIEYDAGSFKTEKNAKVEDLLKVLPGITVDASGKITAQGKTVEKVLVDGEEFFGDDPTLVTRNVRSDMVDKVQVYEKKSDLAERTGVDDGQRIQTINVTLKEDAKNGMFGKLEGGAGDDSFYLGKVAVNKFKGSQKIGAYGIASNNGTVSLGWQDEQKFGIGESSGISMSDDGAVMVFGSGGDEFSSWNGKGRPSAISTGVSFMDKFGDGKQKINLSYKYGRIENDEVTSSQSLQTLSNRTLNQTSILNKGVQNQRHRFNGRYDANIDSLTTLIIKLSGTKGEREANENNSGSSMSDNLLQNENDRKQSSASTNGNFTYDGLITRKFKKIGRSVTFQLAGNVSEDDGDGYLKSTTKLYKNGLLDSTAYIDQYKDINSTSNNVQTSLTYTEPISDKWQASLSYTLNNSKTHSINNSFNNNGGGIYDQYDADFSNDFDFRTLRNAVNLGIGYKVDKFDFNFTNNIRNDDMFQVNNNANTDVKRGFLTYNPSARLRYNLTKAKSVTLSYNRGNQLPSLSQIQPLRQNTDPLNIVTGNEDLTPAINNNYNLQFNSYDMMKGVYLFGFASFGQNKNSIQQNVNISDNGIRTIFYDNISQVNNTGNTWIGFGNTLIKKYSIQGRYGLNANINNAYNYLNGELNKNLNYNYGVSLGLEKNTTKSIDFSLSVDPAWRTMESSLQPQYNSSGFTLSSNFNFKVFLPGKFQLYGEGNYNYEAPTKAFDEKFSRFTFMPGVSKRFLKNESLTLDLYVNDVFNQNIGFSRYQSAGMITQQNYNTISRYFMAKVTWDFTSMKMSN